jgi:hypothetical protein
MTVFSAAPLYIVIPAQAGIHLYSGSDSPSICHNQAPQSILCTDQSNTTKTTTNRRRRWKS